MVCNTPDLHSEGEPMGIILKFALRNIKEKKFRTFLIVFSITISSALFFASSAISGTVERMYVDRISNYFGSAEIMIHANEKSPSDFLSTAGAEQLKDKLDYAIGVTQSSGTYKADRNTKVGLSLFGIDFDELQTMNPVTLEDSGGIYPFTGNRIIISLNTANKFSLKKGDLINIDIRGVTHKFTVAGIAHPLGIFMEDGRSVNVLMPKETLNSFYDIKKQATTVYVKPRSPEDKQQVIGELSKIYKRYTVQETIPREELRQSTRSITTPFLLMVTLVLFMSVFIINTSFRVITMERLPVIGTFRSMGATRKMTDLVLLGESLVYGVAGGILGCGLGIGVLYIMSYMMISPWDKGLGIKATIQFTPAQMLAAFVLAVVLALISSALPIIRVSKIPVKDIVLNSIEKTGKKKAWKAVLGILLVACAYILPVISPKDLAIVFDSASMLFVNVAVILLVPNITNLFLKIFEKLYIYIFGNEGQLAAKNLRENRSILNNISLLAIGISALLMINTISTSVLKEIVSVYGTFTYNFDVWGPRTDKNTELLLSKLDGVEKTYGRYRTTRVEINGTKDTINGIDTIDKDKQQEFFNFDIEGDPKTVYEELDKGRNLLVTNVLKDKYGFRRGDYVTLKLKNGSKQYKIIGFFNSIMWNGNYALAPERYLKADEGLQYYNQISVKTSGDPAGIIQQFKKEYGHKGYDGMTLAEAEAMDDKNNEQMFGILKSFSVMTMFIGIFGVMNNFAISFLQRKRSLAMMRAVGMGKGQIVRMVFIEALTGGLIGGIAGVTAGVLVISVVPYVMKAIDSPIPMHYDMGLLLYSVLIGAIITLIASVGPALKSSKLNIIEAVKYE